MKYGRLRSVTLKEVFGLSTLDLAFPAYQLATGDKHGALGTLGYTIGEGRLDKTKGMASGAGRELGKALYKARRRINRIGESGAVRKASLKEASTRRTIAGVDAELANDSNYAARGEGLTGGPAQQERYREIKLGRAAKTDDAGRIQRQKDLVYAGPDKTLFNTPEKFDKEQKQLNKRLGELNSEASLSPRRRGIAVKQRQTKVMGRLERRKKSFAASQTPVKYQIGEGGFRRSIGVLGAMGLYSATKAVGNAAQEVTKAASGGYADMMRGKTYMGSEMQSADGVIGNLAENAATWATRKRKYGPTGRKPFKFNFLNPAHVHKALGLGNDSDAKKLMNSKANITKHVGMATQGGIPLKYAYASNDRKHLYAGKTIGMRQNIISQHKKLGLPLPRGFENASYEEVNNLFKKRLGHGWYKRNYSKASIPRKIMIGVAGMWKKAKAALGLGESAITETADFIESEAIVVAECVFMDGRVASPMECNCPDCLAVTRRLRESEKLTETSESSFPLLTMPGTNVEQNNTPKQFSKKLDKAVNKRWFKLGARRK